MSKLVEAPRHPSDDLGVDRPGWIPRHITHDWDPSPYAYQTEEESMPGGGLHGQLLAYIMLLLDDMLLQRGLMLLQDVFLLYRDKAGKKQRIAPDLLLMPLRDEPPSAYDLDIEPPPRFVAEITSPDSHVKDLHDKLSLYFALGIESYLVIDAITPEEQLREPFALHAWCRQKGRFEPIAPDSDGFLALPELQMHITAAPRRRLAGRRIAFRDDRTGLELPDMTALREAMEAMNQELQQVKAAHQQTREALHTSESALRAEAAARRSAEQVRQEAEQAKKEAEQARRAAEEEIARLKEQLAQRDRGE